MNVISVKARKMRAVLPRLPTLTSTHSSSTSTTGPPPASTVEYSDLPLSGVTVNVPQLTMSSTLIVGGRPVVGALPRRARPLPRGDCMPGRLPQPTPAPGGLSVVHCVHQPWVSVSNWATEQPAAIRGTAPTPGPMNCGTHFYRRVSQVTRGSRLRGTVRCTGIPPGQSPATAPSHFFYIAVRSQEHTRPHEWRTPFAYRLVLLPYSGVMQHILRVRAGTPPMPSARPGAWGSAPSP